MRQHMTRFIAFFKSFHSGERFQKFAVTVFVFAGYVSRIRNKMFADTNESGYVWTGPKHNIFTLYFNQGRR